MGLNERLDWTTDRLAEELVAVFRALPNTPSIPPNGRPQAGPPD
jgi:hypothetical protein